MNKKYRLSVAFIIGLMLIVCSNAYGIGTIPTLDLTLSKIVEWMKNSITHFRGVVGFLFTLYTIFIAIIIFIENKNSEKTISWLLLLFIFPVFGFFLYIFIGQNMRKRNIFKDKSNLRMKNVEDIAEIQIQAVKEEDIFVDYKDFVKRKLIALILNNSKAPVTVNNRTQVLTNGTEKFKAVKKALWQAKDHIHMEYFIIKNDVIGNEIKDILVAKAKEGIEVRLIYDSVGSWRLGKKFLNDLKTAGVHIAPFLPVFLPGLSRELNYRNHRKIIVIDGAIGFTGGINIGDEYLGKAKRFGFWRDTHLMIEGEAVYALQNLFLNDWFFATKKQLDEKRFFPKLQYYGTELIQLISSGPDTKWESIMQSYFSLINYASERVWITTPYLIPDESVKMALKTAALSGVDVRIIIPHIADHVTAYWASRFNVEELLDAGVKVYTYKNGFIHAKVLLVDESVASVGTANMDNRSFHINFEVNALIYDAKVVKRIEEDFLEDFKHSEEIKTPEFMHRPMVDKIKESIGKILSPLL